MIVFELAKMAHFGAGEHTMIMLSALHSDSLDDLAWLDAFVQDFKLRFTTLLAGAYRAFPPALALSILDPKLNFTDAEAQEATTREAALHKPDGSALTAYDFKRLQVRLPWQFASIEGRLM